VRAVLHNPIYRGAMVWGRRRKRDAWGQQRWQALRPAEEWIRHHDDSLRIVSDELWAAAHDRLDSVRDSYLRYQDGHLWGRPANGKESPYLLTGLATCGVCSGSLYVLSSGLTRGLGRARTRRQSYWCSVHKLRGGAVCANSTGIPREAADASVLAALESSVLNPTVVEHAIQSAMAQIANRATATPDRTVPLADQLATVDDQLARLTEAVTLGAGAIPTLVGEMKALQRRRDALAAELARRTNGLPKSTAIRQELETYLAEWTTTLRRNVTQGRQLLRKLLVGRIIFTPRPEGVEFEAECTLGKLLSGLACAKSLVTPAGFEPAVSTLKGLHYPV
jgi:site-specific DNA recombinase